MGLPNSYTQKPGSIAAYFDAILDAQPPERFSIKFLENLGFTSTNDRLFVSILKELGFLNSDGVPEQRYFEFLDRSRAKSVLADAIKEAYSDLFAVYTKANELTPEDVKNKLRTLYAGKKTDQVIDRISRTFAALCEYADFSKASTKPLPQETKAQSEKKSVESPSKEASQIKRESVSSERDLPPAGGSVRLDALQYHINIVLPESPSQAVYDAIFKSLRDHLGDRNG